MNWPHSQHVAGISAAHWAAAQVAADSVVGLGTGRAASGFVEALAQRCRDGLKVRGVATSEATAALCRRLGLPLVTLDEVDRIDLAVDGADEVAPTLDALKGFGGALVREKVVALSATRFWIVVGPEKLFDRLGTRGRLPIEVASFAVPLVQRWLATRGLACQPRRDAAGLDESDNGNPLLDISTGPLDNPSTLDRELTALPGVLGTGLFLGCVERVLVDRPEGVEIFTRR